MVPTPGSAPLALRNGQAASPYDEAVFRYLLGVDRARAYRAQRLLYLILVALRASPGRHAKLTVVNADALFRGLRAAVREVDVVGWYREGYVAAAVLAQGVNAPAGAAPAISSRVRSTLKNELSAAESDRLRVRVVRLGG